MLCLTLNTFCETYTCIKYTCELCDLLFQHGLISHALRLARNCLTFDFIGTSTDETADDLCTVQIPTGWRSGTDKPPTVRFVFLLRVM